MRYAREEGDGLVGIEEQMRFTYATVVLHDKVQEAVTTAMVLIDVKVVGVLGNIGEGLGSH
jgi:hypothetical protein